MSKLKATKSPSAIQFRKCKVVKMDGKSKFQSKLQPKTASKVQQAAIQMSC